ncbi:hypothetical protein GCM10012275_15770 [Longimycelium tulufanense]|uniref:Uncharacterized protein n=1 Tax=Longimycelium tulufanense TaxID=907463 RepID=A0A8J3C712_9PSEU|nr:hypothetical protein [Longimycelium tulufanense]GGM45561.1 hypothetical protein GCM10012275_15770 [Longimycelium tulufanense]
MGSDTEDVALVRKTLAETLAVADSEPDGARLDRVAAAVDLLGRWVAEDGAAAVLPLAQDVVETVVAALSRFPNDPRLRELAETALAVHAAAARASRADPTELADWLLRLQLEHPEGPEVALADYDGALGATGLAAYRQRAEELCRGLPTVPFGQPPRLDRHRWAVLRVLEELAEHTGDVDLQVDVLAKDLSTGWQYLRIATLLQEAGRSAEVLRWVERGLGATRGRGAAGRLVDLALDECMHRGWLDRALELLRAAFQQRPGLDTFLRLRAVAEPLRRWPAEREGLLGSLRITTNGSRPDLERSSAWVRILLWEGDLDGACRVARTFGCDDQTWAALVDGRPDGQPDQALAVYRRLVERHLARPRQEVEEVPELLDELRVLAKGNGQPDDFTHYLDEVRTRHAADRDLLDALSRRGTYARPGTWQA